MRTVSPEEAKISRDKLERWAKEDNVPTGKGKIGEWIYKNQNAGEVEMEPDLVTESLTKNAVQINWRTPTEFPQCPEKPGDFPLQEYLDRLQKDVVFSKTAYGESKVLNAGLNMAGSALFVATYFESKTAVKGYALAKIEYDRSSNTYYHESRGTFFGEDGVSKYFTIERGYEWTGGEVFDDLC